MEISIPPAVAQDDPRSVARAMAPPSRFGDKAFEWLTLAMALAVVLLVILTGWQLWHGSALAIQKFGFHFLTTSTWDPVAENPGPPARDLHDPDAPDPEQEGGPRT